MQSTKRRYDRFFIMFKQELNGYSIDGREPNGYCKIEIRDGHGRASTYIQGLKPLRDGSMYRVYLISSQGNKSLGVPAGWLNIDNRGRGECRWEFNPDNLDGTGLAIEDFNISAIIVKGDKINELLAPIVGYKDREVLWKNGFKDFSVYKSKESSQNESLSYDDSMTVQKNRIQKKSDAESNLKLHREQSNLKSDEIKYESMDLNSKKVDIKSNMDTESVETPTESITKREAANVIPKNVEEKKVNNVNPKENAVKKEPIHIKPKENLIDKKIEEVTPVKRPIEEKPIKDIGNAEKSKSPKEEISPHKIFNDMVNKFYAEMEELEKYKILSPEDTKILDLGMENKKYEQDIDDIEYMFKNNEKIIPFERPNRAIQWIKIAPFELVTLNLHPWTYIKHQFINASWKKYRHLILGRYSQNGNYNYILGVPDTYDDRAKPIANNLGFNKFVCVRGRIFQKGDMGYWIMEI